MSTNARLREKSFNELKAIYESVTDLRVPFATRKEHLIFFLENLHRSKKLRHPPTDKPLHAPIPRISRSLSKQQKKSLARERDQPTIFMQPYFIDTPTPATQRLTGKCVKGRCDCSLACGSVLSPAVKSPVFNIYIGGRGGGDVLSQRDMETSSTRYDQEVVGRKRTREESEDTGRSRPEQTAAQRGHPMESPGESQKGPSTTRPQS